MTVSSKVRFGVLGCSRVAQKGVLPALRNTQHALLSMVGSRTPEKAKRVAAEFGCDTYGTYDELIHNNNLDAVYISLPHALHEEWSIKALEAGKHVYCEKPAALSYASAQRMVATARKNNVRLIEGLMFRYHPQHAAVRTIIQQGALGDLIRFNGTFCYPRPDNNSILMSSELRGGSLYAAMPHPLAASRMIFAEEPEQVFCHMDFDKKSGVDVQSELWLGYPNGKSATLFSAFGAYFQSTYTVLGTVGSITSKRAYAVPRDRATTIVLDTNDTVTETIIEPADHFALLLDSFCQEISKGSQSTAPYEEDVLAQACILEAAQRSHAQQRVVTLEEIKKENKM